MKEEASVGSPVHYVVEQASGDSRVYYGLEGSVSSGLLGEERVEVEMVQYEVEGKGVAAVTHGGWACDVEREVGEEGLEGDGEVKPDSSRR